MKSELTEKELINKAEMYCSSSEHCISEVVAKLIQWGALPESHINIIETLVNEKYIDEMRFSKAFVRDKYRFNQWGRNKIRQALMLKSIPSDKIESAFLEIDDKEYRNNIARLLEKKRKSIKGKNEYECNTKLIRFALSRGYEMNEIIKCIKINNADEAFFD